MENINMGIVSTVSKNIDFASFKIEEINKEILAATIELKKIGENTELGQIIKSKIEILNDEKTKLISLVTKLREYVVSKTFNNYSYTENENEFEISEDSTEQEQSIEVPVFQKQKEDIYNGETEVKKEVNNEENNYVTLDNREEYQNYEEIEESDEYEEYEEYEEDYLDDLDEQEENIKISNLEISYIKDKYKVEFDLTMNGKTRHIVDFAGVDKKILVNKKKNNDSLNDSDFELYEKIDNNLCLRLKSLDRKYGTKLFSDYLNGKLNAVVKYDLSNIMKSKRLSLKEKIQQYDVAIKQKDLIGAEIVHSNLGYNLLKFKKFCSKKTNVNINKKVNVKETKKKEIVKENSKKPSFNLTFKRFKVAAFVGVMTLGAASLAISHSNSKKNIKEAKDVVVNTEDTTTKSIVTTQNATEVTTENTKNNENLGIGVKDSLALVQRNNDGEIIKNFELTKEPFDNDNTSLASEIGAKTFPISSMIVFDKTDNSVIETVRDSNIRTNELYKKYGSNIGIILGFDAEDGKGNIISKNIGYLDIDKFIHFSDKTKKRIAGNKEYISTKDENINIENSKEISTEKVENINKENETKEENIKEEKTNYVNTKYPNFAINDEVSLVYKENDSVIACETSGDAWGNGKKGKANYVDGIIYKISRIAVYRGTEVLETISLGDNNESVKTNDLYSKYGKDIVISFNFNAYDEKGKNIATDIGWVDIDSLNNFINNQKKNKDSALNNLYKDFEDVLSNNDKFKGYKLTFHI